MIEIDNASFSYGASPILSSVTASLETGSFHLLTGPSGAGKTTFLKLCYLALEPSAGKIRIFGKDFRRENRDAVARLRQRVGVVLQDCQFLDHLSVADNIALPLRVAGSELGRHRKDLEDLIHWVGLEHRAEALPPELSGGERQRVALARAVIMSPDLIIADEPTGNIDWEMGERLLTLLIELNRMGKTVLIATHDLNMIRVAKSRTQARVLRLVKGKLQVAGADL